ncbi:hypothetical protein K0M31_011810 [Melipona bicolor]|uniref:Uncharacterized protein n=1 Tax=Melipona bicolor TaxID=60889 RepID=A0AA40GA94_9HYME|nr:hypothetical protein K0M31_011810 [Melipona bicolor]
MSSYLNNSHDGISRDFIESLEVLADTAPLFYTTASDHRVVEAVGGAPIGPARFRGFEKLRVPLWPANRSALLTIALIFSSAHADDIMKLNHKEEATAFERSVSFVRVYPDRG